MHAFIKPGFQSLCVFIKLSRFCNTAMIETKAGSEGFYEMSVLIFR